MKHREITPSVIRDGLLEGKWTAGGNKFPAPPPEWPQYRRDRLLVAMLAARLFIKQGKSYCEIRRILAHEKYVSKFVTNTRIGQYVFKGMEFLLQRNYFEPVVQYPTLDVDVKPEKHC